MIETWAVRFPRAHVEEVGRLWPVSQVEVCEQDGDDVWLRGKELTEQVDLILRGFLSGQRFQVLPDGQLRSPQARVPQGHLPSGPWVPLRKWMQIELPVAALAGQLSERLQLRIVRADSLPQQPDLLLTDAAAWRQYALGAPQVRLRPLRFACDATGRVIVQGRPLPPLPGKRFVVRQGIAFEAGWSWQPAVSPTIVRELCGLQRDDLALFFGDRADLKTSVRVAGDERSEEPASVFAGASLRSAASHPSGESGFDLRFSHWELIRVSQLVAATRQAIRKSTRNLDRRIG